MFEKLEKIEELINHYMGKIGPFFAKYFSKIIHILIPEKIITQFQIRSQSFSKKKLEFKTRQKQRLSLTISEIKKQKDNIFDRLMLLQKYPFKEKASEKLLKLKTFILETPPKTHFKNMITFTLTSIKKCHEGIKRLNNIYTKVTVSSLVILALGTYIVYKAGYKIYDNEFPNRTPASVQEYDYRPKYRLYDQQTLKILNVKVPVITNRVEEIDTITIDFSLRTSTRFAKHFLLESEYKLRDYFFTNVEPVVANFPLEEEGKDVLKEKIKEEINSFLIDNNVEGEVEEVRILYIIGS